MIIKSVALAKYRYKKKNRPLGRREQLILFCLTQSLNFVSNSMRLFSSSWSLRSSRLSRWSFELVCQILKVRVFNLHNNLAKEVCIKTRSPSASLLPITLKWNSLLQGITKAIQFSNTNRYIDDLFSAKNVDFTRRNWNLRTLPHHLLKCVISTLI